MIGPLDFWTWTSAPAAPVPLASPLSRAASFVRVEAAAAFMPADAPASFVASSAPATLAE